MSDDPGELTHSTSFDDFQRQTSLMTSCTLLWKELSDHFISLEQDLQKKSDAIKSKIETLDSQTTLSLKNLESRELSLANSISMALETVEKCKAAALTSAENEAVPEIDDSEGLLLKLRSFCKKMDSQGFWRFITARKKELESIRAQISIALADCVDPARFVLEAISEVFPEDKRENKNERLNDLGWACVLVLESLIPVVVDPIMGNSRMLVTPKVKENANRIAETWKASLDQRGGIENVKTPDVHTFLQHLVTFGIVKNEDFDLYRKLVVGSAWRKQMPKLAVSLGLGQEMPDMIEELISRGQQVDAVHFTYEVGLADKFPPVPLLKAFLNDARKAATSISEDPNISGRAALAARKEQSALRAVVKCIEEYKLEAEFPPENLKKRLDQLEKVSKTGNKRPAAVPQLEKEKVNKIEKKRPAVIHPANKRTRASNGGPMPPAKAGRLTNAYVSSFPAPPTFVRSPPSHTQYPAPGPQYQVGPPMYGHGSRSPASPQYVYSPEAASPQYVYSPEAASPHYVYSPEAASPHYVYSPETASPHYVYSPETASPHYVYSPEAASPPLVGSYPGVAMNYHAYGGYGNGMLPAYQQSYYR